MGLLSEALETVERARGHLYAFHQLSGRADEQLQHAVRELSAAGHQVTAEQLRTHVVGADVLPGRWTFQIVEEYDDGYYTAVRLHEQHARAVLLDGRRHTYEAALKRTAQEGSDGRPLPPPESPAAPPPT